MMNLNQLPKLNPLTAGPNMAARSRRALWAASVISAIGSSLFAISARRQFGDVPLATAAWLHVGLSAIVFAWTFFHPALRHRQIIGLILLLVVPYYYLIWANHVLLAGSDLLWVPFLGLKIVILSLAVINPGPYWLSLMLIGGFALESIILWYRLNIGSMASGVVAGEPWFTAMFFIVSIGLTLFRWQQELLERQLLAVELRSKILTQVAHLFLHVRDQANTPLQHLSLAVELLARGASTPAEQADGMRRALAKLSELNHSFTQYEALIRWDNDELETGKILAEQLRKMEINLVHDPKIK